MGICTVNGSIVILTGILLKWVIILKNKRDGKWEGWYETGNKKYESNYINGNKSGLYQEWDLKGKIIKNITYSLGKELKSMRL